MGLTPTTSNKKIIDSIVEYLQRNRVKHTIIAQNDIVSGISFGEGFNLPEKTDKAQITSIIHSLNGVLSVTPVHGVENDELRKKVVTKISELISQL